jgi:hypothetical protein
MSKSKVKRTVACGGCGADGHNKRTCPSKGAIGSPVTATAEPPVTTSAPEVKAEVVAPKPVVLPKGREVVSTRKREAPTADRGTAATAAPYRCPKCNQVAILVIVRVKNYVASQTEGKEVWRGDQRCEQCMNKPDPCSLILVWGAKPGQTMTDAEVNAKR